METRHDDDDDDNLHKGRNRKKIFLFQCWVVGKIESSREDN
jgi:hypothetical protein